MLSGEVNFSYYRARYYDPQSGRFLAEDPLHFWTGVDFYPYVYNRSPQLRDPSGKLIIGAAVGAAIGAVDAAIGARLQGGTTSEIITAAIIGGAGGAALGLVDPTEGVITLTQFALMSGALGIASDVLGQSIGNLHKPRRCRTFSLGEAIGAGVGGFLAGLTGGGTSIAARALGMGELGQALAGGGVGGAGSTFGGPAGQALGSDVGGGDCGCEQ
jgi:hypothetical protein